MVLTNNDAYAGVSITNWASVSGRKQIEVTGTNDSDYAVITPKSTLAMIGSFGARAEGGRVVVEWETVTEAGTVGFYLYRSEDGQRYEPVTKDFLPGLLVAPQGGRYRLVDEGAKAGGRYWYRLAEVEANGGQNWFGPYEVWVADAPDARGSGARYERQARAASEAKRRRVQTRAGVGTAALLKPVGVTRPGSLTSGNEARLIVKERGIHVVELADLAAVLNLPEARVKPLIRSYGLQLLNRGEPVAYVAEADGSRLYFYGEEYKNTYTDENVYWLRWGRGTKPPWGYGMLPPAVANDRRYRESRRVERDLVAVPALFREDDEDFWMWEYVIAGNPVLGTRTFDVESNARSEEGTADVVVRLKGGSSTGVNPEHHAVVSVNGAQVGEARWSGLDVQELRLPVAQAVLPDGVSTVEVRGVLGAGVPYSVFYVDWVGLDYDRHYRAADESIEADAGPRDVVTLRGFSNQKISVWDITNPKRPGVLRGVRIERENDDTYRASFRGVARGGRPRYIGFTPSACKRVARMEPARAAGLTARTNRADYVVITPGALREQSERLAAYRAEQGYEAKVVDLQDIFDTFNYGIAEPAGIREFLRYAYYYWNVGPDFVVLAGEGTFDPRDMLGHGDNLLLPKMVGTPHGMYESDTWYGDVVGDDGVPEMAIGRLPALTEEELGRLIDKIVAYEDGGDEGGWTQRVLMVADNPDEAGNFPADSEVLGQHVPESFTKTKAYLSEMAIGPARTAIRDAVNSGVLLLNYIGHGALDRMAQEGLLTNADVPLLANGNRAPVAAAFTCLVGRYGVPGFDSLAELLLLKPDGGMAGVWSPTGLSMNEQAKKLNEGLLRGCFEDGVPTLGEMILHSLEDYGAAGEPTYMLYIYNLLGDPALLVK